MTIPANTMVVQNFDGFSGKGNTVACIVNSMFDFVIGTGHMTDTNNTTMRVGVKNEHNQEQTIDVSCIRLYK